MEEKIHLRALGSACDQLTLVHPNPGVAHVALKEDRDAIVGHAFHHGRGSFAEPRAPLGEAKAGQLG